MPTHHLRTLLAAFSLLAATAGAARADVVLYDSIPNPLPGNVVSLGYAATSTSEFGDQIQLSSGNWALTGATVTLSDWAVQSDYPNVGNASGWTHPITLNLYNVDNSGSVPAVGSLISSTTVVASIPWHTPNGFNGTAFNVTFTLPNVAVPNQFIYGISFNTQNYGPSPLGVPGPYNSLNVGLHDTTTDGPITVGTDVNPHALFWNTSAAGFYTDGGAAGVGIFRQDTNWTPNTPAIQFVGQQAPAAGATPEPASFAVFAAVGLTALGFRRRRQA
jgi:hypothetical protein